MSASGIATPAFCLHTRPYRETSLLAHLLTEQAGRVSVVVKGAKSSVKKRGTVSPLLQPFIPLHVAMIGKADLKTLVTIEQAGMAFVLKNKAQFAGFYLNELLMRLLPEHIETPEIYAAYQRALDGMQQEASMESVLRLFELSLLEGLGYGVPFVEVEVTGRHVGPLQVGVNYTFVAESGFVRCVHDAKNSFVFGGEQLLQMTEAQFAEVETARQAKQLMRMALARLLGDKPLNSKNLFL